MQNYSIMWFGLSNQYKALGFGHGRFRKSGEWYIDYSSKRNIADVSESTYPTRRVVDITIEEPEISIDHAARMRQHLISQFQWEVIA